MKTFIPILMLSVILIGCSSPSSKLTKKQDSFIAEGEEYLRQNDLVNAERSFRLASKNGNPAGIVGLGLIAHQQGNLQQEEYYYRQAYDRGFLFAGYKLAKFYMQTLSPRNCQLGIHYLVEAGFRGNIDALDSLKNEFGSYPSNLHDFRKHSHLVVIPSAALVDKLNRDKAGSGDILAQNIINSLLQKCQTRDWSL
ncbi:hypothetical protein BKK52_03125 [Rodentibacter trehalosifermentans]|uniref:Sel1 repeat family protein n=1 Tax=Rodentibacter trehalosifermentans TaxID=1908263 RepID=A0A1V3J346_9PAST|nr:hypothetical protein [Rodentibacter trehalosifermentans]OOF49519.1 hypothetical protein BKK52_03125 [Rodentibacter trehalosifermentans]